MLVMPADHLINDLAAFNAAVQTASQAANSGKVVAFGVKPTRAETGFGYIEYERGTREETGACDIVSFVEKPNAEVAAKLASDGRHAWNAGIFCFAAQTMLDEMDALATEVAEPVKEAILSGSWAAATGEDYVVELARSSFEKAKDISIDYAVMERTNKAAVVPCDIGWSDIGSWLAISDLTSPDDQGNRIEGAALLHDTSNCYFRSEQRLIGAVGVEDLVVVDTPDALLIARRDRAQDVKQIVSQLKQSNHDAYRIHRTVHRPWGTYTVLEEGDRFKMKRIVVKPGASLSLQMHHHRSEHWIVVRGCADVVNGEQVISLQPNESTYIPAGHKHRLINPGVVDLVLIEVQCGEYLGEDDIVRFEDVYGRAPAT
ncbi:Alginate biosynthesis protein AlgA [Burkholderia multivorans]|nr:Alginate biosynthesis protein AlgA [Burkholderia multivorans]MDR9060532.1 Alginate biosynthesis protein AlgA [Burkholderia multivorans]MDR9066768.1 Alginate biosynthesis protein AlgA [Burkholderia multivorans]MDR9078469.1 Alginate biosynthesis protein AlgA [Burkholderia multivorans]MDR9084082.1 Alginate biosynthesis protein AlgA [Burkholderia multivorans]